MKNSDETTGPEAAESRFSGLHTRTYEAELLISGAVVFGLFRLIPVVSRFFDRVDAGLEGHHRLVMVYGQGYFNLVLYSLIGTFLLHLAMRAFWIGLVGLESVFPGGVKWKDLKAGPFFKDLAQRKLPPLARAIERTDDLCSLIFGFGFLLVVVFLYSVGLLLIAAIASFLLSATVFAGRYAVEIFWATLGLVLGIQVISGPLDRLLGPRFPDGRAAKFIAGLIRIAWVTSPMRWIGNIQLTLQSNTSNTRVTAAMTGVMLALGSGFVVSSLTREGVIRFDNLVHFPTSLREEGVDPNHYRRLRAPGAIEPSMPSIQSDIVKESFLKLSIPYSPRRINPLIKERCPDLQPLHPPGLAIGRPEPPEADAVSATLQCLASLIVVELDGAKIDPGFVFSREKESGLACLVAYLPTEPLQPGGHRLVVLTPSREMARGNAGDPEPTRHVIPFWK